MKAIYNRDRLILACGDILTDVVVAAMQQARISPPEIVKMAALQCFLRQDDFDFKTNFDLCMAQAIIKQALNDLYTLGQFDYQE